jgi:Protein of unknown function (DUF4232)
MVTSIRRTVVATAAALTLGIGGAALAASVAQAAPANISTCSTGNLSVWVDVSQPSGAAGSVYYPLDFTNTGGHACTLRGYPGVSATLANGDQLGGAAERNSQYKVETVTIPAGGTAHAILTWVQIGNFTPSDCKPATASLIKVYPPNRKSAAYGFFSLQGCRSTKPLFNYLSITTVQPGVGHAV